MSIKIPNKGLERAMELPQVLAQKPLPLIVGRALFAELQISTARVLLSAILVCFEFLNQERKRKGMSNFETTTYFCEPGYILFCGSNIG